MRTKARIAGGRSSAGAAALRSSTSATVPSGAVQRGTSDASSTPVPPLPSFWAVAGADKTARRPKADIRVRIVSVSNGHGGREDDARRREERGDTIAHLVECRPNGAGDADGGVARTGGHRVAAGIA